MAVDSVATPVARGCRRAALQPSSAARHLYWVWPHSRRSLGLGEDGMVLAGNPCDNPVAFAGLGHAVGVWSRRFCTLWLVRGAGPGPRRRGCSSVKLRALYLVQNPNQRLTLAGHSHLQGGSL